MSRKDLEEMVKEAQCDKYGRISCRGEIHYVLITFLHHFRLLLPTLWWGEAEDSDDCRETGERGREGTVFQHKWFNQDYEQGIKYVISM